MSEYQAEVEAQEFLTTLADSVYDPIDHPYDGEFVPDEEAAVEPLPEPVTEVTVEFEAAP